MEIYLKCLYFLKKYLVLLKNKVHSVTIGNFRMANNYLKRMVKINPTDPYIFEKYISQILPNTNENTMEPRNIKLKKKFRSL